MHQLGLVDIPEYKHGVPCRSCFALTLVRQPGADRIECGSCSSLLSFLEYDDHVRSVSAEQVQARRFRVAQIKALRSLLVAMRSAGWQYRTHVDEETGWRGHTWTRDGDTIEHWTHAATDEDLGVVAYHRDGTRHALTVHTAWVTVNGFGALTKLARAAGLLTLPKRQEVAA
jgi:hypothetical protein